MWCTNLSKPVKSNQQNPHLDTWHHSRRGCQKSRERKWAKAANPYFNQQVLPTRANGLELPHILGSKAPTTAGAGFTGRCQRKPTVVALWISTVFAVVSCNFLPASIEYHSTASHVVLCCLFSWSSLQAADSSCPNHLRLRTRGSQYWWQSSTRIVTPMGTTVTWNALGQSSFLLSGQWGCLKWHDMTFWLPMNMTRGQEFQCWLYISQPSTLTKKPSKSFSVVGDIPALLLVWWGSGHLLGHHPSHSNSLR